MGKLTTFDIRLNSQQAVFHPGQVVSGQVVVELAEEMKMRGLRLRFIGAANVHWTETIHSGQQVIIIHHNNHQSYFNTSTVLYGKAEGASGPDPMHPPGCHVYPFQFTLPKELPSSFEGLWGRVRYRLHGVIDKPWKFNHECKKAFTVLSPLDLNKEPAAMSPKQNQTQKHLCCLCCKSGPISATLHIDRTGYVPGEFVTVFGEVTNYSNRRMVSSTAQIVMVTSFHATTKTRKSTKIISQVTKGEILPGDSEMWNGERLFIPPLPPTKLPNCDIINITYTVQVLVKPAGPAFKLVCPIEILIGTIPLQNTQYVFANTQSAFTLPSPDKHGNEPPAVQFPANVPTSGQAKSDAPKPVFATSVFGAVDIREEGESEHMRRETNWAPAYTYYSWSN